MNRVHQTCRVVAAVLLWGCADQASVGRDTQAAVQRAGECDPPWHCDVLDPQLFESTAPAQTRNAVTPLAPTWTKHTDLAAAHELYRQPGSTIPWDIRSGIDIPQRLARGRDGRVWLFDVRERQFEARLLDADGEIVERRSFTAPADVPLPLREPDGSPARIGHVDQHASGPVVPVIWPGDCTEGGQPGICAFADVFVFDQSTTPTARVSAFDAGTSTLPTGRTGLEAVYRSKDGNALLGARLHEQWSEEQPPAHLTVNQTNLRGELTWNLDLPIPPLPEGTEGPARYGFSLATGAVAQNGDLVHLLYEASFTANGHSYSDEPIGILRVSSKGEATLFRFGAFLPFVLGQTNSHGLAFGVGRLSVAPSGELLLIQTSLSGDLVVLRISEELATLHWAQREEYRDLVVGPSAVDEAGTVYVATATGGREYEDAEPRLCAFPAARAAHCYAIEQMPVSIHAALPNVVYAAGPDGLSRFDVPVPQQADDPADEPRPGRAPRR